MKFSVGVDVSFQHVCPHDVGVVWVRVLAELRLDHGLPVVAEDVLAGPDLHAGGGGGVRTFPRLMSLRSGH